MNEAMKNYNKIFELNLIKGRTIKLAVIVSLYHACELCNRNYNNPVSIERILHASDSKYTIKQVKRYYRKVISSFQHDPIEIDLEQIARDIMNRIEVILDRDTYRNLLSSKWLKQIRYF